jgi:hypothetical protein
VDISVDVFPFIYAVFNFAARISWFLASNVMISGWEKTSKDALTSYVQTKKKRTWLRRMKYTSCVQCIISISSEALNVIKVN